MRDSEKTYGFGLLTEAIEAFRGRALERRVYGQLLVPAWLYPEAIAEAHDYAIVSHNHSVRLRQADRREHERLDGEARLSARWARLCRRYASKHQDEFDGFPDSDAMHDAARLQWYGATDERSRLNRGEYSE